MPRTISPLLGLLMLVMLVMPVMLVMFVMAASGCATTLVPAPGAHRVPGVGHAADARLDGVHIVAAAAAWTGFPSDLDDIVTPMLVTITNDGARPLEIRYEHFALVTPGGVDFAALPPFQVTGVALATIDNLGPTGGFGFSVAPYLSPWYPGWSVYGGPFPYHPGYYGGYYGQYLGFGHIDLPTSDMLQRALPEGVLEPGGRISGFVYFERMLDVVRIAFVARLIAVGGQDLGTIEIPFIVD